jgi:hypothetical protein
MLEFLKDFAVGLRYHGACPSNPTDKNLFTKEGQQRLEAAGGESEVDQVHNEGNSHDVRQLFDKSRTEYQRMRNQDKAMKQASLMHKAGTWA